SGGGEGQRQQDEGHAHRAHHTAPVLRGAGSLRNSAIKKPRIRPPIVKVKTCWMPYDPAIWTATLGATPPPKTSPAPITRPATDATMPSGAASAATGPARIANAEKLNNAAKKISQNSVERLLASAWVNK